MTHLRKSPFLALTVMCILSVSCVNTKKIVYFNNVQDTTLKSTEVNIESVIQKNDLLHIAVSSLNPEASLVFNMPSQASSVSSLSVAMVPGMSSGTGGTQPIGYLVNSEGDIKFPVIGRVHAAGLTKKQLENTLTDSLLQKKLLIDPIVNVRFLNFRVTVLGEVARPTTINVGNERISLLEALGLAGDLTIYGKRENVLLIREDGGNKIIHRINLTSDQILNSPYYYLKTNDIVYVEPNTAKIASTNRTQQLLPIILSGLSFIAVIISYSIIKH